ncbi:hypothetical protein C8Q72DRAFT_643557 [Fomitopsis betulina]|nr:hypothetical protein C8Q72DRAFT_643557 [Fomitopsis betulina]
MWPTESLLTTALWQTSRVSPLRIGEVSYLRAESISKAYGLTLKDVATLSPKLWKVHRDPIVCIDGSAVTLLTIQYNLCLGTICRYLPRRKDLLPLARSLADCTTIGQFCLTEVGHGLDAFNLGTTATLLSDGSFNLHSPSLANSKYMPPTVPVLGRPCVAVVFAQLVVKNKRRGVRPFLVTLNDGTAMCEGITSRLLPHRDGAAPVNHSMTTFQHVNIPPSALLGSLDKSLDPHGDFLKDISRIGVGTLCISAVAIPMLQTAAHIAFKYSVRRKIGSLDSARVPIISFRTQQLPIFYATAQAYVLPALYKHMITRFTDTAVDSRVRHACATIFKAMAMRPAKNLHLALSDRCGAQGLFSYNQIVSQLNDLRGVSIAEGETLVLSIRLASELLQARYTIPPAADPTSLLAQHESAIFDECRQVVQAHGHRSKLYASLVLPRSSSLVEAIGARMAYDAAVSEGVPRPLIDLYVSQNIKDDLSWYVETGLLTRAGFAEIEDAAFETSAPLMDKYVEQMGAEAFVQAPIVSDAKWGQFVQSLEAFESPETASENSYVDDAPRSHNGLLSLGRQVLLSGLQWEDVRHKL